MASDVPATFWDSAVSPLAASISEGTIQSYQTLATAVSHVMNEIKSTIPSHRDLFESKGEHNLVRQILDVLDQRKSSTASPVAFSAKSDNPIALILRREALT